MLITDPHKVHILQICAQHGDRDCTSYVTPARPIDKRAGEVNGINYDNHSRIMTYKKIKVRHITLHNALLDLLDFLSGIEHPVLVAHNGKSFDFIILYRASAATGLLHRFKSCVQGFMDTLPLCRNQLPGYDRHSLKFIYAGLLHEDFPAHDAKNDCIALEKIITKLGVPLHVMQNFFFGWDPVMDKTVRLRMG